MGKKQKSETEKLFNWPLWRLLREDGMQGYLVMEPGGVDPMAFYRGLGPGSLRRALRKLRSTMPRTLLHHSHFTDALLLPVDHRGKLVTIDVRGKPRKGVNFSSARFTPDGYFALAIASITEERVAKISSARRAKRAGIKTPATTAAD